MTGTSMVPVPNLFPTIHSLPYRIAIIGEAPGEHEVEAGQPFVGSSGQLLDKLMSRAGILRAGCLLANCCQYRPPNNDIELFPTSGPEFQESLSQLNEDLGKFNPHLCILLGNTPLSLAYEPFYSVTKFRGSVFLGNKSGPFLGRKCLSVYHPAACLRMYDWVPVLGFDLSRGRLEGTSSEVLSEVETLACTDISSALEALAWLSEQHEFSFDVEGYPTSGCSAIAFYAPGRPPFCIPLSGHLDGSYWSLEEEKVLWKSISTIFSNPLARCTMHNGTYDSTCLIWRHKIVPTNFSHDTMLSSWELFPELPKSLQFVTSIYTKIPFYKDDKKAEDLKKFWSYNAKDTLATMQVKEAQHAIMTAPQLDHYNFNMQMLPPVLFMMLNGCKFDHGAKAKQLEDLQQPIFEAQEKLNSLARKPVNVNSPKQIATLLYKDLALPEQTKRGTGNVTSDYEALISLRAKTKHPVLESIIHLRSLTKRVSMWNSLTTNDDGRVRCSYNVVGTETGRLSSSESSTGSGTNLQTIPDDNPGTEVQGLRVGMRHSFVPDPDHELWQCDLAGADGWTVAAHCLRLGYPTMWEDYLFGLKPAKILVLMLKYGVEVNGWTREKLKDASKEIQKEDWQYFCMKQTQHGCITGDHEVLTRAGWKRIDQLADGEEVAAATNSNSPKIFWEVPSKVTRFLYTGEVHSVEGSSISLLATHDHKIPFNTNKSPKDLPINQFFAKYKSGKLPLSGTWCSGTVKFPHAKLAAAFQSDGCQVGDKVAFHFSKERKVQRLQALLLEAGIDYKLYKCQDGTTQMECYTNLGNKLAGPWMLEWDAESMKEFVLEYPHWDGHHGETSETVFSVDRNQLLWIETLSRLSMQGFSYQGQFKSGFSSTVHRTNLNVRCQASFTSCEKSTRPIVNEPMYCVTVRSGFFMVRRNNKIFMTGNSNYGMKPRTLRARILIESEGKVVIPEYEAGKFQNLYFLRYSGVRAWQNQVAKQLTTNGTITSASGHTRVFMGRRTDETTLREALSDEPQENTTFACNLALWRMWNDPENRTESGALRILPLLQVHDAVVGQWKTTDQEWARTKVKSFFSNRISIADHSFIIPYEGRFGKSWSGADLTNEI